MPRPKTETSSTSSKSKARNPAPIPPLSDQVRAAIARSGLTAYDLAQQAGVHRSVVSRFLSGTNAPSLDTVDRLAAVLRLKLR